MLDGIVIMKVLIAMLENMRGKIDEAVPLIISICMRELMRPKVDKNYKSMVIQTICMSFWYNNIATF